MRNLFKKVAVASAVALAPAVSFGASILPASVATDFADGKLDILTMVGLVFGVITTIYVFRLVKRMFA